MSECQLDRERERERERMADVDVQVDVGPDCCINNDTCMTLQTASACKLTERITKN